MRRFFNRPAHGRDSMDDTAPLLPDGRYQGHYQESPPRQSARAQDAARYNATPDGEYMTTKREAFKKLLKNRSSSWEKPLERD
jgi:hypothetical protein